MTTTAATETDPTVSPEPEPTPESNADAGAGGERASIADGLAKLNEGVADRLKGAHDPADEARVDAAMERWKDTAGGAEMEPYRPTLMPSAETWAHITRMADDLSRAVALPSAIRGKPADIALVLLTGRDVGVGPTTALNKIYVIEGRPTMAAELMRALIIDRGHDIWFEDVTDDAVTVCAHRANWPTERVARVTWTLEMAQTADLAKKDVWKKFRRSMLKARATSEMARDNFPDVLLGVSYTPEELGADVNEEGEPLRVASTAWSENSTEAPAYEPAPQIVIDAFLARIEAMSPEAKTALAAKWKQLQLRPLKATEHKPQVLGINEISLAGVAFAEVERDTPAEAEIVGGSEGEEGQEGPVDVPLASWGVEDATGVPIPLARAQAAVADLTPSEVLETLDAFEDATYTGADETDRAVLVAILASRILCPECGRLREGSAMLGETLCGCETA